jgi:hypothetical protein
VPKPDLRQLARQVLERSPGDGLGLAFDPEAQLDAADVAADRYFRGPSQEALRPWREVIEGIASTFVVSDLSVDVRVRLDTHQLLLDAAERWHASAMTGIDELRKCVSKVSEELLAREPSRASEIVRGLGEFLVSALWGNRPQAV